MDAEQTQRLISQGMEISRRLGGRNTAADRLVLGMKTMEWIGKGAAIGSGVGVVYLAAKKGGTWAVIKTATVVVAAIAAEQQLEKGLRAAGASEEVIRGTRLAAAVVSFIILRRRLAADRAARPTNQQPPGPKTKAPAAQPKDALPPASSPPKAAPKAPVRKPGTRTGKGTKTGPRPGSISGNPMNRLIETGTPTKNGGWVRRWVRMNDADYQRWLRERYEYYEHVRDLADRMRLSSAETRRFRFEQMRRWRTEWLRTFLENRDY